MAIIVRSDLRLTKGKIASQCAHAAIICYQKSSTGEHKNNLSKWLRAGQPKVVLKVDGYEQINQIKQDAHSLGIVAEFVCDAGRTQVDAGTVTVLGLGPDSSEKLDQLIKELKLL